MCVWLVWEPCDVVYFISDVDVVFWWGAFVLGKSFCIDTFLKLRRSLFPPVWELRDFSLYPHSLLYELWSLYQTQGHGPFLALTLKLSRPVARRQTSRKLCITGGLIWAHVQVSSTKLGNWMRWFFAPLPYTHPHTHPPTHLQIFRSVERPLVIECLSLLLVYLF